MGSPISKEQVMQQRWVEMCSVYAPLSKEDSIWRLSRETGPTDLCQGVKLHISATILNACGIFESIAPFLIESGVQFKVPRSLKVLGDLNAGFGSGYSQVGKCFTVYPNASTDLVGLAKGLEKLTAKFESIAIPFDRQLCPGSNVFYRFGAFSTMSVTTENGAAVPGVLHPSGKLVPDDRFCPFPDWVTDPLTGIRTEQKKSLAATPLGNEFRIVRALSQRGKGGVYLGHSFVGPAIEECVIKEGRRNGELDWDGNDGRARVKTEAVVLSELSGKVNGIPRLIASFEAFGNSYVVIEKVDGQNLEQAIRWRQRRLSSRSVVRFARFIAGIIEQVHKAGWVWGDCKPANLICTNRGGVRPIDFEGAFRIDSDDPYRWRTLGFSDTRRPRTGVGVDLFSLGATLYFLITGRLYDCSNPQPIRRLRVKTPRQIASLVSDLLEGSISNANAARERIEALKC